MGKRRNEFAENRKLWEIDMDDKIERLSKERRPLNDRFEEGVPIFPEQVLQYIAALERRIEHLEGTMWGRKWKK